MQTRKQKTGKQGAGVGQYGSLFYQRFFQQFFRYVVVVMAIGLFSTVAMAEKINLNQADAETLEYIPGIGPTKAVAIIKLREQIGGFKSFEDVLEVRGIGIKILEAIKAHGTLEGGVAEISQEMLDNPPKVTVMSTTTATDLDTNQADEQVLVE